MGHRGTGGDTRAQPVAQSRVIVRAWRRGIGTPQGYRVLMHLQVTAMPPCVLPPSARI